MRAARPGEHAGTDARAAIGGRLPVPTRKPIRLQLSRKKGFNLQSVSVAANGLPAINCARPGPRGNPFPIHGPISRERSLALFENAAQGFWSPTLLDGLQPNWADGVYKDFSQFNTRLNCHPTEYARGWLKGSNLACWCGPDVRCHVEVWLALANNWALPGFEHAFRESAGSPSWCQPIQEEI